MRPRAAVLAASAVVFAACAGPTVAPPAPASAAAPKMSTASVDPRQAERLQRVMLPLVRAMNHPIPSGKVKVGILDDPHINAANAGNGEFYVTRGLLEKANDQQLMGVMAHEIAHEDLSHVAKAQRLGAGLKIGMVLLDQIIPGSGALTPIAGQLIAGSYSRKEEYQADQHGAELLQRIGVPKQVMIDTLTWLVQTEGAGSGGFFSTHPATADRIEALRRAP